jgi:hypothetical protein
MANYKRKTKDEFVLLINYGWGDGWEQETVEESYKEIKERLKEYRLNCPQYVVRYKKRRVKLC